MVGMAEIGSQSLQVTLAFAPLCATIFEPHLGRKAQQHELFMLLVKSDRNCRKYIVMH